MQPAVNGSLCEKFYENGKSDSSVRGGGFVRLTFVIIFDIGDSMGENKVSRLDVMRARLWLAKMLRVTGSANINQFGKLLDNEETKKLLYNYVNGKNSPSLETLANIDTRIKQLHPDHVDGKSFFLIGPESARTPTGFAPLWDALGGSIEKVGEALISLDPPIGVDKYLGIPFGQRCGYLIYALFDEVEPPAYWENSEQPNRVAERYRNGEIILDIDLITFAIAAWRMANFVGEQLEMMNYIMIGLLERGIQETLDRLYKIEVKKSHKVKAHTITITDDLLCVLEALGRKDLEDAEDAIKDLNYNTPSHPVGGQLHDYRNLIDRIKRSNVAEYLAPRISCSDKASSKTGA